MNMNGRKLLRDGLSRLRVCIMMTLVIAAGGMIVTPYAAPSNAPSEVEGTLTGFHAALDAGHGGYDGGARARDSGIWEKELTLKISLAVERELLSRGASVTLTRREDVCLCEGTNASHERKRQDLIKRYEIAENANADVLLSIHLNEYRDRSQNGPQVFYQQGGDAGRLLAGTLQRALIDGLKPLKERAAMPGDYRVLRGRLPSALVECGFLSNAREEKLLLTSDYHRQIAIAIADGLEAYRELLSRVGE